MTTLRSRIVACQACPRLIEHCREVARRKRRAYVGETYWGKPVPSFGVRSPRLLVVGLAPGAHGANRTGRVFTGDASGDWLYRALHRHGFANQPEATGRGDGLRLVDAVVNNVVRCAPPKNKPVRDEIERCRRFLEEEIASYARLQGVVALGKIAFDSFRKAWAALDRPPFEPAPRFAHGAEHRAACGTVLLASYHPSRQNTQTGRLSRAAFEGVFGRARRILGA